MNAEKFFETHSLEEISKKTKISPISLRFIKNREFDKIQRVKFIGFVKIIQKTYKIDLSELINEYNQTLGDQPNDKELQKPKNSNNSTFFLSIAAFIMLILGSYLFYEYLKQNKSQTNPENNYPIKTEINSSNFKENFKQNEQNLSKNNTESKKINSISKIQIKENNSTNTTIKTKSKKTVFSTIEIIPREKVWFRAINLDTNKTFEYLTSNPKTIPKGNYYIKFGHGNETIVYNNQTIFPDTKKIVRILLQNGNYKFIKSRPKK